MSSHQQTVQRHKFSEAETEAGLAKAHAARRNQGRSYRRLQRDLAKLGFSKEITGKLIDFMKVWVLTPAGSIIATWLIIDGAEKINWLPGTDAAILKGIITADNVIGALAQALSGQQTVATVGAGIAALEGAAARLIP